MLIIFNLVVTVIIAAVIWNVLTAIVLPLIVFVISTAVSIVLYLVIIAVKMLLLGAGIAIAWKILNKPMETRGSESQLFNRTCRESYIHEDSIGSSIRNGNRKYRGSNNRNFREHREYPEQEKEIVKNAKIFFNIN